MYAGGEKGTAVRIRPEVQRKLESLAKQTRKNMSEVAQKLIEYALKHVAIRPVQLYDIVFIEEEEK